MCISKIDMVKVKKFFKEYLFAKFQCKNRELYRQLKDYDPKDDQKYLKWEHFVEYVEQVLEALDKTSAQIIKEIYIQNKRICELPYSYSTYYAYRKKAIIELLAYLDLKI